MKRSQSQPGYDGGSAASATAEPSAEALAQRFHETYERLAPSFGYETREASAKPWADVPDQNKRLMVAVCAELLAESSAVSAASEPSAAEVAAVYRLAQEYRSEARRGHSLCAVLTEDVATILGEIHRHRPQGAQGACASAAISTEGHGPADSCTLCGGLCIHSPRSARPTGDSDKVPGKPPETLP